MTNDRHLQENTNALQAEHLMCLYHHCQGKWWLQRYFRDMETCKSQIVYNELQLYVYFVSISLNISLFEVWWVDGWTVKFGDDEWQVSDDVERITVRRYLHANTQKH